MPGITLAKTQIEEGQTLPEVRLEGKDGVSGELVQREKGEKIEYINWNLKNHKSKVLTILHLSARASTEENIKTLVDLLDAETYGKYTRDKYVTINILNYDDINPLSKVFFSKSIAKKRFIKRLKKRSEAVFVLDDSSKVRKAWGLTEKGCAVILLDKNREVVFFRDTNHVLLKTEDKNVFLDRLTKSINE